jgi:hypothetical protein
VNADFVTGSSNSTSILTRGLYRGGWVELRWEDDPFPVCAPEAHQVEAMHHIGEDGEHFCPTGFVWCTRCCAVGGEPDPPACTILRRVQKRGRKM